MTVFHAHRPERAGLIAAVHHAFVNQRRHVHGIERTGPLARPLDVRFRGRLIKLDRHAGPTDAAGEKQIAPATLRAHDAHAVRRLDLVRPIRFAGGRVQGRDGHRVKHDQLRNAPRQDHARRGIAGLFRVERLPLLLARLLVERDDQSVFPADETNHVIAIHHRVPREAPDRRRCPVILAERLRPDERATLGIQTAEVAHRPDGVHAVAVNGGRATRAARVTQFVPAVVLIDPERLARLGIETMQPFCAAQGNLRGRVIFNRPVLHDVIRHVDFSLRDGRARVAQRNRHRPQFLRPVFRERIDDPRFGPDAVAVRAHPLGPVRSECRRNEGGQNCRRSGGQTKCGHRRNPQRGREGLPFPTRCSCSEMGPLRGGCGLLAEDAMAPAIDEVNHEAQNHPTKETIPVVGRERKHQQQTTEYAQHRQDRRQRHPERPRGRRVRVPQHENCPAHDGECEQRPDVRHFEERPERQKPRHGRHEQADRDRALPRRLERRVNRREELG